MSVEKSNRECRKLIPTTVTLRFVVLFRSNVINGVGTGGPRT